jgi:hypothetical protein
MALVDRIREFRPPDFSALRPFRIGGETVGWIRHRFADLLASYPETFEVADHAVTLSAALETPQARTAAVDAVVAALHRAGEIPKIRNERFAVANRFPDRPLMTLDRAAVTRFGTRAFGIHLNGYVGSGDSMRLWVGKRAKDKAVAPGKLDHLVAGGQPAGLGIVENLVKEAGEEADIPEALARQARPTGFCSYIVATEDGIRNDVLFNFDLALKPDFVPRNTDGEIESFELMPVRKIIERMAASQDFKFNVALVNIDFLIRHGFLSPDDPDYAEIVSGLRL